MAKTAKPTSTRMQSQLDGSQLQSLIEARPNSNGKQGGMNQTSFTPSGILKTSSNFNQTDRKVQKQQNHSRFDREDISQAGGGSAQMHKRRVIVSEKQSPMSVAHLKSNEKGGALAFSLQGTMISNSNTNANRTSRKALSKQLGTNAAGVASVPESHAIQGPGSYPGRRGPKDILNLHQRQGMPTEGTVFQSIEFMEKASSSPNKQTNTSSSLQNQRPPMSLQEKMEKIKRESINYKKNGSREYQNTANSRNHSQHGGSSIERNSRRMSNHRANGTHVSVQKNLNISLQSMSKLSRVPSQHSQSRGDIGEIGDAAEPVYPESTLNQNFMNSQSSSNLHKGKRQQHQQHHNHLNNNLSNRDFQSMSKPV